MCEILGDQQILKPVSQATTTKPQMTCLRSHIMIWIDILSITDTLHVMLVLFHPLTLMRVESKSLRRFAPVDPRF